MRTVPWLATAYVVTCGGVLVAAVLGLRGMIVHADAQTYTLILGLLLIAAGIVLRPRRGS